VALTRVEAIITVFRPRSLQTQAIAVWSRCQADPWLSLQTSTSRPLFRVPLGKQGARPDRAITAHNLSPLMSLSSRAWQKKRLVRVRTRLIITRTMWMATQATPTTIFPIHMRVIFLITITFHRTMDSNSSPTRTLRVKARQESTSMATMPRLAALAVPNLSQVRGAQIAIHRLLILRRHWPLL